MDVVTGSPGLTLGVLSASIVSENTGEFVIMDAAVCCHC